MLAASSNPRRPPCLVVGGGFSGLAAALLLSRAGYPVEVAERSPDLGGLAGRVEFRGIACDLGSHRLHPAALRAPVLSELAEEGMFLRRPRRGRLLLSGRAVPYPPRLLPLARALGARRTLATAAHLARRGVPGRWESDRRDGPEDVGFEEFVRRRVGPAAYEAFYRPYAQKVWGVPPDRLSQTVAKKRVSTSHPLRALRGGEFVYPRGGMSELIDRLADKLRARGVALRTGAVVEPGDHRGPVLWSGPLGALVPTDLEHRGLTLVFLAIPQSRVSSVDTWYAPEERFWFGRVSELGNFSPALRRPGETVLCVEIPQGQRAPGLQYTSERLPELVAQLAAAGILRAGVEPIAARQVFLPRVYPLYTRGWRAVWKDAMDRVAAAGDALPFGRQGLFLHCNLDHCAAIAEQLVDHLERGGTPTAWAGRAEQFLGLRVRD